MLGVLLDEIDNVACVEHLVHADDAGMLQLLDDEQLARQKAAHDAGARAAAVYDLDGDDGAQVVRPGALHVRVRAAADQVAELDTSLPSSSVMFSVAIGSSSSCLIDRLSAILQFHLPQPTAPHRSM